MFIKKKNTEVTTTQRSRNLRHHKRQKPAHWLVHSLPETPSPPLAAWLTEASGGHSLVVLRPTRAGSVWDIQFEIMAMELSSAPSCSRGGRMAVQLTGFPRDWQWGWCPAGSWEACPQQPHLRWKRDPLPALMRDGLPSPLPPAWGSAWPCLFLAPQTLGSLIPGVFWGGLGWYLSEQRLQGGEMELVLPSTRQRASTESVSSRVSRSVMGCSLSLIKNAPAQGGLPAGHCRHTPGPADCFGHSQGREASLQRSSKIWEIFLKQSPTMSFVASKKKKRNKKYSKRNSCCLWGAGSLSGSFCYGRFLCVSKRCSGTRQAH